MTPEIYWRIKAALLQVELAQEKARALLAGPQAVLAEAMRQAGLDPAGEYRLNDAAQTITRVDEGSEHAA